MNANWIEAIIFALNDFLYGGPEHWDGHYGMEG